MCFISSPGRPRPHRSLQSSHVRSPFTKEMAHLPNQRASPRLQDNPFLTRVLCGSPCKYHGTLTVVLATTVTLNSYKSFFFQPLEQSNPLYTTLHTSLRTQPNHFISTIHSLRFLNVTKRPLTLLYSSNSSQIPVPRRSGASPLPIVTCQFLGNLKVHKVSYEQLQGTLILP